MSAVGLLALSPADATTPARQTKAIVQTFLVALPGRRADLGRFIELNWLAMDRQGIDQGIFSHARLLEVTAADAGSPVDYVMEVGYFTAAGYADVEVQFAAIRGRHRSILVNGRGLSDLGRIVGERRLRPVASA